MAPSLKKLLATVFSFGQESPPKPEPFSEAAEKTDNKAPQLVPYAYTFEPIVDKVLVSDGSVFSVLNEPDKAIGVQLVPTGYIFFDLPNVEPGRTYTWSGRIRAETAGVVSVASWDGEFTRSLLDVGTEWSDFEVAATPDQARLRFYIDTRMKGVTIGNVELQLGAVQGQ